MAKRDMSLSCGLRFYHNWVATYLLEAMSVIQWGKWYNKNCRKCKYMNEACMYEGSRN